MAWILISISFERSISVTTTWRMVFGQQHWEEEEEFGNVEPSEEVELLDPEEGDQYLVLESGGDDDYLKLIHIEELKNETITIDESNLDGLGEEEDFDEDMGEL